MTVQLRKGVLQIFWEWPPGFWWHRPWPKDRDFTIFWSWQVGPIQIRWIPERGTR